MPQDGQPIIAQLPNGTQLQFPSGTAPDVVQRVVRHQLGIPTIGAAPPPTAWQRLEGVFGAGPLAASHYTLNNPEVDRSHGLINPQAAMTPAEQERHPVLTGVGEVASGLTEPKNLVAMAAFGGASKLAEVPGIVGPAARAGEVAIARTFAAPMVQSAIQETAWALRHPEDAARQMVHAGADVLFAGLGMLPGRTKAATEIPGESLPRVQPISDTAKAPNAPAPKAAAPMTLPEIQPAVEAAHQARAQAAAVAPHPPTTDAIRQATPLPDYQPIHPQEVADLSADVGRQLSPEQATQVMLRQRHTGAVAEMLGQKPAPAPATPGGLYKPSSAELAKEMERFGPEVPRVDAEKAIKLQLARDNYSGPRWDPTYTALDDMYKDQLVKIGNDRTARENAPAPVTPKIAEPVAAPAAPLTQPKYPGPGATDAMKAEYAKARDAYMAQQAKLRPAQPQPQLGHLERFDQSVKRFVKSPTAQDAAGRINELKAVLQDAAKTKSHEDLAKLRDDLQGRAAQASAQAEELKRVAAAPEKLRNLSDALGRNLFGEWTNYRPEEAERAAAGGEVEPAPEGTPFQKTIHVNEVPPAERDVLHALMGHALEQSILPKSERMKLPTDATDLEQVKNFEQTLRASFQKEVEGIRQGADVDPGMVERLKDLRESLNEITQHRERLARGAGVPRKLGPEIGPSGEIKAPGVIPDISQKVGNLLTEKPVGAHFKRPSPEKLAKFEDERRNAATLYSRGARWLDAKLSGQSKALGGAEKPIAAPPVEVAAKAALPQEPVSTHQVEVGTKPEAAGVAPNDFESRVQATMKKLDLDRETAEAVIKRKARTAAEAEAKPSVPTEEAIAAEHRESLAAAAPKPETNGFIKGFPPGDVPQKLLDVVKSYHDEAAPEGRDMLADAVREQRLGTAEGAYKLYGRALKEYTEGLAKQDFHAFGRAMNIARRRNEAGFLRANFIGDVLGGLRQKVGAEKPVTLSEFTQLALRKEGAKRYQFLAGVTKDLGTFEKQFDKLPLDSQFQIQKHIQDGSWSKLYAPDSVEYKASAKIRALLDLGRDMIQQAAPGRLKQFYENYFPQRWQGIHDLNGYLDRVQQSSATLRGKMTGLREKYYEDLQAGWDAGLRPAEYNPARVAVNSLAETAHFVMGQKVLDLLKDNDLITGVRNPRKIPPGWEQLTSRVAGAGQFAPADVARVLNKYFDPGIFNRFRGLDHIRVFNSVAQMSQVALSGFHMGLTAGESMISDIALGLKYAVSSAAQGRTDLMIQGLRRFAGAAPGLNTALTIAKGRDWFNNVYSKTYSNFSAMPQSLRDYLVAGGRPKLDPVFDTSAMRDFHRDLNQAIQQRDWSAAGRAVMEAAPAALRYVSSPIMDAWVPYLKLGTTLKMLEYQRDVMGPGASSAEIVRGMREVQDSADNRFGQMVQQNLFWNPVFRDLMGTAFKFVDFNYGTLREGYGAVKDVPRAVVGGGMSHRLAHALALPIGVGLMGAITQFMLTGQAPQSAEDYFFPRNGRVGADGKPERILLTSYLRPAYEWAKPSVDMVKLAPQKAFADTFAAARGRMSPLVNLLTEWVTNKDYQGNTVVNKTDPTINQLGQFLGTVARQMEPISVTSLQRAKQLGAGARDQALAVLGLQPAPRSLGLDMSPAELELQDQLRSMGAGGTQESLDHARAMNQLVTAMRNNSTDLGAIYQREVAAGHLKPDDISAAMNRLETPPLVSGTNRLSLSGAISVLQAASTREEFGELLPVITRKLSELSNPNRAMSDAERQRLWERAQAAFKHGSQLAK